MNEALSQKLKDNCFQGRYTHITADPTLSELIKACGSSFEGLQHGKLFAEDDGSFLWYAKADEEIAKGPTPEEAVANLWLAINTPK